MPQQSQVPIILVEDDEWYARMLEESLSVLGHETIETVDTGAKAIQLLEKHGTSIVTLDYYLSDETGDEVLQRILQINPNNKVIIVSAQEDIGTSVELVKAGAFDYIVKGKNIQENLWKSVRMASKEIELQQAIDTLNDVSPSGVNNVRLIGSCSEIQHVKKMIDKSIKTNINVCLFGETGTGKEVVAKLIHQYSDRKNKPFVPVNLSSISSELFESELFGHEKGAFTGANKRHVGYFEQAHGGTLFLDEIAELDLKSQVKLLRVLQERNIVRVGGETSIDIDIRLICATHRDLKEEVAKGRFREDLFYRLYGLTVVLPPLRERLSDLKELSVHFMEGFCAKNGLPPRKISTAAFKKLLDYSFPGNVRELKSIVELACVLSDEEEIGPEHISVVDTRNELNLYEKEMSLKEHELEIVLHYLRKYKKDIKKTASVLKIGKSTIYKMLKDNDINIYAI